MLVEVSHQVADHARRHVAAKGQPLRDRHLAYHTERVAWLGKGVPVDVVRARLHGGHELRRPQVPFERQVERLEIKILLGILQVSAVPHGVRQCVFQAERGHVVHLLRRKNRGRHGGDGIDVILRSGSDSGSILLSFRLRRGFRVLS